MLRSEQGQFRTITELAAKYGITLRTLRFYEERGLLNPVRQGLLRLYSAREEIKLMIIQKGKRLGFTLSEIERLLFEDGVKRGKDINSPPETVHLTDMLTVDQIVGKIGFLEQQRASVNEALEELRRAQSHK